MERKDIAFICLFVVCIGVMLYYLGTSITGYAVQSMYCENGICQDLCRSDLDCFFEDEMCCLEDGIGVCRLSSECGQAYSKDSGMLTAAATFPIYKTPHSANMWKIAVNSVILFTIIAIGLAYLYRRKA